MGLMASHQLSVAERQRHQLATGMSSEQLQQLHMRFQALDRRQQGYLTPTELLRIPQLLENPMYRQIVDGFFGNRERLDFEQFVGVCARFMVAQFEYDDKRQEKLRLLSHMFDTKRGGDLEREDFRRAMRCVGVVSEQELQLLEQQAFGRSEYLTYAEFEARLGGVDVEQRLVVRKWLEQDKRDAGLLLKDAEPQHCGRGS
ncbi:CG32812 [Drosophila busckii]|uniref:CG32812 n=1 Tax=Drosophila busckii TaxID=30019 RepID=A0A0M4EZ36_DROBS|nr:calcineurin B homologous protein 2 [Drosophila busckii]ALC49355.1 CG32812 [Drosophila busckii]